MKKLIIGASIVIGVIFVGFIFIMRQPSPSGTINQGELSERSREFITEQSEREETTNIINIGSSTVASVDNLIENCFYLKLDWSVRRVKQGNDQTECFLRIETINPRAVVTISVVDQGDLSEYSGVSFRQKSENYETVNFSSAKYSNILQFKSETGLDTFVEVDEGILIITMSETRDELEPLQKMVEDVLGELVVHFKRGDLYK